MSKGFIFYMYVNILHVRKTLSRLNTLWQVWGFIIPGPKIMKLFVHKLKLLILKTQIISVFVEYCLLAISFTWQVSYPFMANREYLSNQTVDLSLKSFMILGPELLWVFFYSFAINLSLSVYLLTFYISYFFPRTDRPVLYQRETNHLCTCEKNSISFK